jgi:hypothetical protein
MKFRLLLITALLRAPAALWGAADLPTLWAERTKSVVAVEYMTETETERRPTISMGHRHRYGRHNYHPVGGDRPACGHVAVERF